MKDTNNRTSPRRILNILEEIIIDPDNFTAKKISHKLKYHCLQFIDILKLYVKKIFGS